MPLYKIFLFVLFATLPLIHGQLFPTLWIDISLIVSWNFEFFKVMYFNIFAALILFSYTLHKTKSQLPILKSDIYTSLILIVSTLFSLSPFLSLIGDVEKWHTAIMFVNLLGLFMILRREKRAFLEQLIITSIFALWVSCLIGLKEYFIPSFNYGELWNRFIGTYGHPNYFSWFVVLCFPFTPLIKNIALRYILYAVISVSLIISQSLIAIFLLFSYLIYKVLYKNPTLFSTLIVWLLILWWIVVFLYFPEKLHSFISRYYLWETSIKIVWGLPLNAISGNHLNSIFLKIMVLQQIDLIILLSIYSIILVYLLLYSTVYF